jgi:hypothetical protein
MKVLITLRDKSTVFADLHSGMSECDLQMKQDSAVGQFPHFSSLEFISPSHINLYNFNVLMNLSVISVKAN